MKTLVLPVLLMSAAAFSFANEAADEVSNRAPFEGQLTRAEVYADFLQARADGTLPDSTTPQLTAQASPAEQLTRAEVVSEYIRARSEGSLVDTSEAGSMHMPVFATRRDRPQVYAERVAGNGQQAR